MRKQKEDIDQGGELDAGVLGSGTTAEVHLAVWVPAGHQCFRRLTKVKIHFRAAPAHVRTAGCAGARVRRRGDW